MTNNGMDGNGLQHEQIYVKLGHFSVWLRFFHNQSGADPGFCFDRGGPNLYTVDTTCTPCTPLTPEEVTTMQVHVNRKHLAEEQEMYS